MEINKYTIVCNNGTHTKFFIRSVEKTPFVDSKIFPTKSEAIKAWERMENPNG